MVAAAGFTFAAKQRAKDAGIDAYRLARLGGFGRRPKNHPFVSCWFASAGFSGPPKNRAKGPVVKTYPLPSHGSDRIIGYDYVFTLHHPKEKRQATSLLQSG